MAEQCGSFRNGVIQRKTSFSKIPWLDEAQVYPISINEIERADYVLLTLTHDDHSDGIGRIRSGTTGGYFVGDLSAEALL